MTLIPADWKTASNPALKLASRSCSTNLARMPASSEIHQQVPGLLYHPGLDRALRCSENPGPAATVFDDGQDVHLGAVEQAGVKKSSARIACPGIAGARPSPDRPGAAQGRCPRP
jgi:hypothetical protein